MPTISFTSQFIQSNSTSATAIGRMIQYGAQIVVDGTNPGGRAPILPSGAEGSVVGFAQQYCAELHLMKGTVPTQANINSYTGYSDRSADTLVSFTYSPSKGGPNGTNYFSASSSTWFQNPASISTIYNSAAATGIATWFWLINRPFNVSNGMVNGPLYQQFVGTIGVTGSGADLEIPSTTINVGQQIRVLNIRFVLPTTFTY